MTSSLPGSQMEALMAEKAIVKRAARVFCAQALNSATSNPMASEEVVLGNLGWQLRLQASMDGELSQNESGTTADGLAAGVEAELLLRELALIKLVLAGNEPECRMSQSREVYWSRIERVIARTDKKQSR